MDLPDFIVHYADETCSTQGFGLGSLHRGMLEMHGGLPECLASD